jgi:hypothetical protein
MDYLVVVAFDEAFRVTRAYKIARTDITADNAPHCRWNNHVNGYVVTLPRAEETPNTWIDFSEAFRYQQNIDPNY